MAQIDKDAEEWGKDWQEMGNEVPWQLTGPHQGLVNNIKALTNGESHRTILVPLCGATDDMIWLADQGHTVVGIEVVREAIKLFFKKNQLEYEMSAMNIAPNGAYIYKAKSKNITIVEINFWHFNKSIAGDFDGVWDRGALIAVLAGVSKGSELQEGSKYLGLLKNSLKPNGRILMETLVFDKEARGGDGPPFMLPGEQLQEMCKESFHVKTLERIPIKGGEKFQERVMPFDLEANIHSLYQK